MRPRFWISGVVLFVVLFLSGFVVHGLILQADYAAQPQLMRTEADSQAHFGWMFVGNLLMGFGFTCIYRQGRDAGKPWPGQGLRFGLLLAVTFTAPMYLIYYVVQPWPGSTVVKQIGLETIVSLVVGLVAAVINTDYGPKR
jgi:hypothetical protein